KNAPYGIKTRQEVKELVLKAVEDIVSKEIKALVVACNTATSIAIKDLREKYKFPIIGMEPAIKPAVESGEKKRILVAATELTLKEERFKNLVSKLDKEHIVDAVPLSRLVDFCEKGIFDEDIIIPYLQEQFQNLDIKNYSTLVLGCTHFPFYKNAFIKIFPKSTHIIDGNTGTVKRLKHLISTSSTVQKTQKSGEVEFYDSGKKMDKNNRFLEFLKRLT
ncbi:MAG: glutamate racemase, partial [Spirochaetota bacterium]